MNDNLSSDLLSKEQKLGFRDQLREARGAALKDAEAFTEILFVIERLGAALQNEVKSLGVYKGKFLSFLGDNAKGQETSRIFHTPFEELYKLVKDARNDAQHQGAKARHITTHAIRLSIIIEDALTKDMTTAGDYMVRMPVIASKWHPVSYVRQLMLENSFSFIPFYDEDKMEWLLISDVKVAYYLQSQRNVHLTNLVRDVFNQIKHHKVIDCKESDTISDLMKNDKLSVEPCLIFHPEDPSYLLGLITAFDIL